MLSKFEFYGFRGVVNKWFESYYLKSMKQLLEINSIKSDMMNITSGVPQGSILGPILFLLYITDISHATNMKLLSFADDTTVSLSGSNIDELISTINNELKLLYDWLCDNKLSLINYTEDEIYDI